MVKRRQAPQEPAANADNTPPAQTANTVGRGRVRLRNADVTPAPAPAPAEVVLAPVPVPTPQRPISIRRRNSGGLPSNWWLYLLVFVLVFTVVWMYFHPSAPTSVDTPKGDDTVVVTEVPQSNPVVCHTVEGYFAGRNFMLLQTVPFQREPEVNSRAILDAQATTSDYFTASEVDCDANGNYWFKTSMQFSDGWREGWVRIASRSGWWFVWQDEVMSVVPATTEEAQNSVSMRSILIGNGSCVPQLQPADFFNANVDQDTVYSGYWIRSNENPRPLNLRTAASTSAPIVQYGGGNVVLLVGEPIEVISYSDGFHYSCGSGYIWWNVRYHDLNSGRTFDGWMAEGDGSTMYMEGY